MQKSLLEMALKSLETPKQARIYRNNQATVDLLRDTGSVYFKCDNLQIKESDKVEKDGSQLPMVTGKTINVDLNRLPFPATLPFASLKNAISLSAMGQGLKISEQQLSNVNLVPFVFAIPGKHAEQDTECKDVSKAEFVPVYNSLAEEKRVVILAYPISGEGGLRVDHMKLTPGANSMGCLGRKSGQITALSAIEIPNLIAADLKDSKPEVFAELQKNACIMVVIEYDLQKPPIYPSYGNFGTSFGATRGGNTRGGLDDDFDSGETYRGGSMRGGVSAYSVLGQGSQVQDTSRSITEQGEKIVRKIHAYVIGAMVVNSNGETVTPEQRKNIAQMMHTRVAELNQIYSSYKIYRYEDMTQELNTHLLKYGINVHKTDIFEHTLLNLAGIISPANSCHFDRSEKTPENFFADLPINAETARTMEKKLDFLGCRYIPEYNHDKLQALRFSLAKVFENMPMIKAAMDANLTNEKNLTAYKQHMKGVPSHEVIRVYNCFTDILNSHHITYHRSNCLEKILLKMFNCPESPSKSEFRAGEDFVGKIMDMHFFFNISKNAAEQVITAINQKFPSDPCYATFVTDKARIADKGDVDLSEIIIDNRLLNSEEFKLLFKNTLDKIAENEPLLLEKWRLESNTQRHKATEYADTLNMLGQKCQKAENTSAAENDLGEALFQFSAVLKNPEAKTSQRKEASDSVRRRIAFFESTQSAEENAKFKTGMKREIKEAQVDLALRPRK